MTPEYLAARLESGWCPIESPADMERAAAELRRLAVEMLCGTFGETE